jgi:hypothetical protein
MRTTDCLDSIRGGVTHPVTCTGGSTVAPFKFQTTRTPERAQWTGFSSRLLGLRRMKKLGGVSTRHKGTHTHTAMCPRPATQLSLPPGEYLLPSPRTVRSSGTLPTRARACAFTQRSTAKSPSRHRSTNTRLSWQRVLHALVDVGVEGICSGRFAQFRKGGWRPACSAENRC